MPESTTTRIAALHVGKIIPPPYAGVEAHVDTLLRSFGDSVDATLVACQLASRRHLPLATPPYRLVPVLAYGRLASVALSPGMLGTIRREFSSGRANLLHLHAPNPWGDFASLMLPKSVPTVMTWHSDIVRQKRLMVLYSPIQRKVLDRADRIIVFTPKHYESSQQLRGQELEKKIVTIPLGIDFSTLDSTPRDAETLDRVDRWATGRPVILTVGRHIYYKGYEYLLTALSKLRSDAVLVMIGDGPLRDPLQDQARALGIADRVMFLGEVPATVLVTLLHRCDIFTLPSIEPSEAFGIATAEAMACGKPTVVCALGNGVNYLTRSGETGLAPPPRDAQALADALDTLVSDDTMRTSMGRAADRWVRSEFSVENMRSRTVGLYRSLM